MANQYGLGGNGQAVRNFFSGNPLTNSKGEYFPMTKSLLNGLSGYGNRLQNAFLSSGVNTDKTGFNSGRLSYTAGTPPVKQSTINPVAPAITTSVPEITKKNAGTVPSTAVVGRSNQVPSGGRSASKLKAPPPLVAAQNPTAAVQASTPTYTVTTPEPESAAWGNAVPQSNIFTNLNGLSAADANSFQYGLGSAWGNMTPEQQVSMANELSQWDTSGLTGTQTPDTGAGWAGGMDTALKGAQALSGLANAYLGYKNYKLARDQFGFEKAATNRALANQASEYNTGIQNAGEVGMGLAGNTMDANARAMRQAQLDSQKISTAPIG